jgi:hypothetical protein
MALDLVIDYPPPYRHTNLTNRSARFDVPVAGTYRRDPEKTPVPEYVVPWSVTPGSDTKDIREKVVCDLIVSSFQSFNR